MSHASPSSALSEFLRQRDPLYYGKAIELRDAVKGWLAYIPQTFPHYTRHTVEHSDEIVSQISKFLFGDSRDPESWTSPPTAAQPLLMTQIAVGRDQKVEVVIGSIEQLAIVQRGPAAFVCRHDVMADQEGPQRSRSTLVEQDACQRSGLAQAPRGMLQHGFDLPPLHSGEPLEKLVDGRSVLEILEERPDRNPSAGERPRATHAIGCAL